MNKCQERLYTLELIEKSENFIASQNFVIAYQNSKIAELTEENARLKMELKKYKPLSFRCDLSEVSK